MDKKPEQQYTSSGSASRFNFHDDVEVNTFMSHNPTPPPIGTRFNADFDPPSPKPQLPPQRPATEAPYYPPPPPPTPSVSSSTGFTGFSVSSRNSTSVFHRDETQVSTGGDSKTSTCPDNQFSCQSNHKCIPIDRMCDRYGDCEDNSDETFEGCHVRTNQ